MLDDGARRGGDLRGPGPGPGPSRGRALLCAAAARRHRSRAAGGGTLARHHYAFTSSSYLLGPEADTALKARLEQRTRGIPVVIPAVAAVEALRTRGLRRLALIHPPWFREEVTQAGATYFRGHGFDVVHAGAVEPARGFSEVPAGELYEWARKQVPAEADAVFFGGNGLRAIGVIRALEEDLDCTVLTANQVALWQALRCSGTRAPLGGYGRLFTQQVAVDAQAQ